MAFVSRGSTGSNQKPKGGWLTIAPLPCPHCGGTDLDVLANIVECLDCEFEGPSQSGPEFMCDWRDAINDWNIKAGGEDYFRRSPEKLLEQGLLPVYVRKAD